MKAESLARRIALAGFALVLPCGCATHDRSVTAPKMSKLRTAHELRVMTFNLRVPPPLHRSRRRRAANSRRHENEDTLFIRCPVGNCGAAHLSSSTLPGSSIKPFTALSASFSAASAVLVVFFGALTIG